jgi:hypothetical protein
MIRNVFHTILGCALIVVATGGGLVMLAFCAPVEDQKKG